MQTKPSYLYHYWRNINCFFLLSLLRRWWICVQLTLARTGSTLQEGLLQQVSMVECPCWRQPCVGSHKDGSFQESNPRLSEWTAGARTIEPPENKLHCSLLFTTLISHYQWVGLAIQQKLECTQVTGTRQKTKDSITWRNFPFLCGLRPWLRTIFQPIKSVLMYILITLCMTAKGNCYNLTSNNIMHAVILCNTSNVPLTTIFMTLWILKIVACSNKSLAIAEMAPFAIEITPITLAWPLKVKVHRGFWNPHTERNIFGIGTNAIRSTVLKF